MAEHNEEGIWGEEVAQGELERQGYLILERDWRNKHRDIDIIALENETMTLCFVEVKTRSDDTIQSPEEAVDCKKIRNLAYAANAYLRYCSIRYKAIRFDIIAVVGKRPQVKRIDLIKNAFNPMLVL
ncbi:YraN family protein [Prevotella sp. AGR2160]|uniref:YraN family protein n=1 Tax=Prevotella sp. AGR2160 TaxID=1280674 RepID=UPI000422885F|nr:YraN family protein [Prevotella sp. AGR2160]